MEHCCRQGGIDGASVLFRAGAGAACGRHTGTGSHGHDSALRLCIRTHDEATATRGVWRLLTSASRDIG
jgi:hypothetical protein